MISTSLKNPCSRKDDQLPRHTAIVGLLARNLANSLDQREQFALLIPWRFQYLVCFYGMEHAGAQVDMNRLMNMREQLASDANHAQETAWRKYAGERVNPAKSQTVAEDSV